MGKPWTSSSGVLSRVSHLRHSSKPQTLKKLTRVRSSTVGDSMNSDHADHVVTDHADHASDTQAEPRPYQFTYHSVALTDRKAVDNYTVKPVDLGSTADSLGRSRLVPPNYSQELSTEVRSNHMTSTAQRLF